MKLTIAKYIKGDRVLWAALFFLAIISLVAVYSSTGTLAYKYQQGNTIYYFLKHFLLLIVGLSIVFVVHYIPYKIYSRLSILLLVVSIPLLVFTLFIGTRINEASRWLTLPVVGVTMQTSDLAKLSLIMYVARILSLKQDTIKEFNDAFLPVIIPVFFVCALIFPANFSTTVLLFVTSLLLMFIGRVNFKYLIALIGIGILVMVLAALLIMHIDTKSRVGTWKHRLESFMGEGGDNYQATQSKIAIATGGLLGKGPGNSMQRNYLPHPYSDFIYAIIIEEYGLVGGVLVLLMYLFILYRASIIVKNCNRTFPAFLSFGLAVMLVFQAMINMMVNVNLLPVTGQPLPFLSMGGSSILFSSVSMGIILGVSRELEEAKNKNNNKIEESEKQNNGTYPSENID